MLNMIELDHRFVVVGGLIVACLIYQVPFFTIAAVFVCGCAVYAINRYKKGDRVSLGLNGFQFVRQTRSVGRLRPLKTPPNTTRLNALPVTTPRNQTWGNNLSLSSSPVSPCIYGTYSPYRGYLTSKMLQVRLNQGSPKTSLELGSKGISSESPGFFQKQSTGSLGGKPDVSVNKPDTSYNDICQVKYIGVGIYPTVHLEPSLPHLLSNVNSTMTKSRVTVKVAPREKASFQKSRFQSLQDISADTYSSESNLVIDALKGARKRSMKDDASKAIQKRQKVETKSASQPFLNPSSCFLPNGIEHSFKSRLCDESMLILPPHFANEHDVLPTPLKPQLSKKNVTGLDSIESSYSSSKKMTERVQRRRKIKRKPEHDSLDMPGNKISRSKMSSTEIISSSNAVSECQNLDVDDITSFTGSTTDNGIALKLKMSNASDDQRCHSSLDKKPRLSPVLGSRSSSSMYIPSYIPTLDDYLQDKILNEQRLQKMLSAIAGKVLPNEVHEATTLEITGTKDSSMEPVSKALESQLPTSLVVTASTLAPVYSFGKAPSTDSTTPSLTKSSNLATVNSAPDVNQSNLPVLPSVNLTTIAATQDLPQASSTSSFTPTLPLNVTNTSMSSATTTSSFSLASTLSVPATSGLPVTTTSMIVSSATPIGTSLGNSFVVSTPAVVPFKTLTNPLIASLSPPPSLTSFGHVMTSSTAPTMNSSATNAPPVPFSASSSMHLNFGNAPPTSLNTSTVASVMNPLFSFGSPASKSDVGAFSAGTGPNNLGVSTSSWNPAFSMTLPTTSVPSVLSAPISTQAASTVSTGFQFSAYGSQVTSPLNNKTVKETAASGMIPTPAVSGFSMSPFGIMASNNNVAAISPAPSMVTAVRSKPLVTNSTTNSSPFQQGSNVLSPNGVSESSGFEFGLTQNASSVKNTASIFASPNVNQGINPFVTSQPLSFGTNSTTQIPSFGSSTTGTSLTGISSSRSSSLSTNTPFAFGNGTSAFATKSSTGQLGTIDLPLPPISGGFGTSNAGFGANNDSFGPNNASFGASKVGFGTSNAGFGTSNAGFGSSSSSTGFGVPTINGTQPPCYSSSVGNTITTFGVNTKQPSVGGFSFGNTATTTTTMFGNSSAVSPNSSTTFQFNGPSVNHLNANLMASSSNNNENNSSLGSPFTFKTQATQASSNQGFNFNPRAQPSFNFGSTATPPSTSSIFSIGTGNVAPRLGKASARQRINR